CEQQERPRGRGTASSSELRLPPVGHGRGGSVAETRAPDPGGVARDTAPGSRTRAAWSRGSGVTGAIPSRGLAELHVEAPREVGEVLEARVERNVGDREAGGRSCPPGRGRWTRTRDAPRTGGLRGPRCTRCPRRASPRPRRGGVPRRCQAGLPGP